MAKSKKTPAVKKVVWRMSSAAPLGEYVSPEQGASPAGASSKTAPKPTGKPDPRSSWKLSSLELSDGLLVSEQPLDSLPGDLIDEFFKR